MPRRIGILFVAFCLLAAVAVFGAYTVSVWREKVAARQDLDRLDNAREALLDAPQKALNLFYISRSQGFPGDTEARWLRLQRDAFIKQKAFFELVGIYDRNPHIILESEIASILTHRVLSEGSYEEEAQEILTKWKDREDAQHDWLEAEVHAIINFGRRSDATELLSNRLESGETDIREVLLAAQIAEDPKERAEQLSIASSINPDDLQLRLARADYFESTNQPRLALSEYNKALATRSNDPRVIHLISSFLLRHRNSDQALSIWENAAGADPQSYVRALIWKKLIRPLATDPEMPKSDNEEIRKLMRFVRNLPAESFFDEDQFSEIRRTTSWNLRLEEIYWLQLLEQLRTKRFNAAHSKMQQPPPSIQSYNPGILRALHLALEFMQYGTLDPSHLPNDPSPENAKPLLFLHLDSLVQLSNELSIIESELSLLSPGDAGEEIDSDSSHYKRTLKRKKEIEGLLSSEEILETKALLETKLIVPAIFLAGGWSEAALLLAGTSPPDGEHPEWFTILWGSALRQNRTPQQAVEFLINIKNRSINEDLLLADLYLETSDFAKLRSITDEHRLKLSDQGSKATSLAAREALARGEYNEAISIILQNRTYSLSVSGHELAARIYLIAGNQAMAADVLRRIQPYSSFAKAFIAADHFRNGELEEAKQGVLELLSEMPERESLRASLLQILRAEEAEKVAR